MQYKTIGLALSLVAASCTTVATEPATESSGFSVPEGASVETSVQIPMRDGARLNADIYRPAQSDQPVPVILVRTPYDTEMESRRELHERLLGKGYAIIEQHERGRYLSDGTYAMLDGSLNDGLDTMDWITAQDWSDGQIGTLGCSSSAENQLKLAAAGHPSHKAMVVGSSGVGVAQAGPFHEQGNFWRGGVWQQGWMDYFLGSTVQAWPQLPAGLSDAERQRLTDMFELTNMAWEREASAFNDTRMHLPMVDISDIMNAPQNELKAYLTAGLVDPGWSKERISEGEMIAVPGMWSEAIYDLSPRSTVAYFDWNRKANAAEGRNNQVMRITQGGHCSFGKASREKEASKIGDMDLGDMRWDYAGEVTAWFDRWMKPGEVSGPMPPAYTAYLGDGDWLKTDALPMGGEVWNLGSAGLFGTDTTGEERITFQYDPANPVIAHGGEIAGVGDDQDDGAFDQRAIEARDDVIVFTSEPMDQSVTLFGYAQIGLSVASDRPDTDFTVKLVDVYPDGRAFNMGDTILRMRYRDGPETPVFMETGTVYDIQLPPVLLSRRIDKKHRIRVEVSSSNFPSYARNLNTDQDPYTSTDFAIATNTIYVGKGHNSFVRLPVQ